MKLSRCFKFPNGLNPKTTVNPTGRCEGETCAAVFGIMDLASGKDLGEVGVEFGKKALASMATAKLNTAFGGLNAGIDSMSAGIGKTVSQMGAGFLQGTYTSMVTSGINSVTYSAKDGWGFDSDGFSKGVVSGLVGSAVQAVQTATSERRSAQNIQARK
jgi:hypothetical protein